MNTETTNEIVVPAHYNPNQIVTYKIIDSEAHQADYANWYPTVKVSDLEYELHQHRRERRELNRYTQHVGMLESRLPDYLDMDSEEIVADICSIFGFNPTKEIQFEATATITGTISVPLDEVANFDVSDIDLNVYAELSSYDGEADVEIDNIYKV
jgi:hypothetical protein